MTRELSYPRKDFLTRTARLLAAGASGALLMPGSPARSARTSSPDDPIAANALRAARHFDGVKLKFAPLWGGERPDEEASFAAQWTKLTGVEVRLDGEAADVLEVFVTSIPDFAERGWITPLDELITRHGATPSMRDYPALTRSLTLYRGRTWGFVDDSDVWPVFYRKDLFQDSELRSAYRARFDRNLRVPRTWEEFSETAQFITEQRAPAVYGTGMGRELVRIAGIGGHQYFYFHFLRNGGRFFDRESMRARINGPAGLEAVRQMLAENAASIPGIEKLNYVDHYKLFVEGRTAMIMTWPVLGRISENVGRRGADMRFMPRSKVVGKVGYTSVGGVSYTTGGTAQAVSGTSKHKEAAYLFAQWLTSPSVSLARLEVPITYRDPSRSSHLRAEELHGDWPGAKAYAQALCEGTNVSLLPLIITGGDRYGRALDSGLKAIQVGNKPVQQTLDATAANWDRITMRLGVNKQRRSYQSFLQMTGSSLETTAPAKGLAVKC